MQKFCLIQLLMLCLLHYLREELNHQWVLNLLIHLYFDLIKTIEQRNKEHGIRNQKQGMLIR